MGCTECPAAAASAASICAQCGRPLPLLKRSRWFPRPDERLEDDAREAESAATAAPLPAALRADLESIQTAGAPARGARAHLCTGCRHRGCGDAAPAERRRG